MARLDWNPRTAAHFDRYLDELVQGHATDAPGVDQELAATAKWLLRAAITPAPARLVTQPRRVAPPIRPRSLTGTRAGTRWRTFVVRPVSALTSVAMAAIVLLGVLFTLAQSGAFRGGSDDPWLYGVDQETGQFTELDASLNPVRTIWSPDPSTSSKEYRHWQLSEDGSALVQTVRPKMVAGPSGLPMTYRVFDSRTGSLRSTIVSYGTDLSLLSPNGDYLVLHLSSPYAPRPTTTDLSSNPTAKWAVYDTDTGQLVSTIQSGKRSQNLGFDDRSPVPGDLATISRDGTKLLALLVPAESPYPGPWSMALAEFDLASGSELRRVALPDVKAGGWQTGTITVPAGCITDQNGTFNSTPTTFQASVDVIPGMAISPDGTTLAIAHANDEAISLVDLGTLAVKASRSFTPVGVTTNAAAGDCATDTLSRWRGIVFGSNTVVYVTGFDDDTDSASQHVTRDLGIQRIDVVSGKVTGYPATSTEANVNVRRIQAIAGKKLFVTLDQTPREPYRWLTQRLSIEQVDATSLEVLSKADLPSKQWILVSPVRIAPLASVDATPVATPAALP